MLIWNIEEVQAIDYFKWEVCGKQAMIKFTVLHYSMLQLSKDIQERFGDTAEKSCYSRKSMYKIIELW